MVKIKLKLCSKIKKDKKSETQARNIGHISAEKLNYNFRVRSSCFLIYVLTTKGLGMMLWNLLD